MNDSPLDSLPQSEWDALISSILRPFLSFTKNDPLITAEDLEQEAWVGLLSAARNYDSTKAKFTTYAYHYIRGRILRYILQKTRLASARVDADMEAVETGYTDKTLEDSELLGSIFGAVAEEPHANFLVEHYVNGKSFRKIAKNSGMSHQGVAMHVKRLIKLLEKRLQHENAQDHHAD
jgi:RNA polymerase sigma factor (sigma-70 family)